MESSQKEVLKIHLSTTSQTPENSKLSILDLFDQFFMVVIPCFNQTCKGVELNQSTSSVCRDTGITMRKFTHQRFGFACFVDAHGSDRVFIGTF